MAEVTEQEAISVLLTGGSGFLGKYVVEELLAQDAPVTVSKLRIFDLATYDGPADERIEMVVGDIRNFEDVVAACRGMDAVIHSAAVVDWGTRPEQEVHGVNYTGTLNVIEACRQAGTRNLVFTSSVDAIYSGKAMTGLDESVPYPGKHPNMYCESKALAEKLVLASNSAGLVTSALRPTDIYGPGDPFHIESLVEMAKGGFYVRLGNGTSRSQHTFVGNTAYAHVLLLSEQVKGNRKVPGSAYFITDGPASNFFSFFDSIVTGAGYRIWPRNLWIPRRLAYAMGSMAEFFAWLARPVKKYNPKFSRFAVIYTCNDFTFSAGRARDHFGFIPKYSEEEAYRITVEYYKKQHGPEG